MTDDMAAQVIERRRPSPKPRGRDEEAPDEEPLATTVDAEDETGATGEGGTTGEGGRRSRLRWLPRGRRLVVTVLSVVIVAFAVLAGVFFFQYRSAQADQTARDEALAAAKTHAAQMLSYDYRSFDSQLAASLNGATGGFRDEFQQLMSQVVAPTAKQQQVVTTSTVAAASVVGGGGDKVTVLLFVDQSTTAKDQQGAKVGLSNVRMDMQRVGDQWLVSNMQPV